MNTGNSITDSVRKCKCTSRFISTSQGLNWTGAELSSTDLNWANFIFGPTWPGGPTCSGKNWPAKNLLYIGLHTDEMFHIFMQIESRLLTLHWFDNKNTRYRKQFAGPRAMSILGDKFPSKNILKLHLIQSSTCTDRQLGLCVSGTRRPTLLHSTNGRNDCGTLGDHCLPGRDANCAVNLVEP